MRTLSESLLPKDTHLQLKGSNPGDILEELLMPLRQDSRVRDWEGFRSSIIATPPAVSPGENSCSMTLHHSRSDTVTSLVLAVGRSRSASKSQLYVVAGIPSALNPEYLRVLGAISRVCQESKSIKELLEVPTHAEFISCLEKGCSQ